MPLLSPFQIGCLYEQRGKSTEPEQQCSELFGADTTHGNVPLSALLMAATVFLAKVFDFDDVVGHGAKGKGLSARS